MDHATSIFNGVEEKPPNDVECPICGICGEPHESSDCDILSVKTTISDTPVLSKARLSLPVSLNLVKMADDTLSVQTIAAIEKGTRFGPYEAKEQFTIAQSVELPLKVFKSADDNYFKEFYLDTTNEYECNWMYFVKKANSLEEQNLYCYQEEGGIYFVSVRDIVVGEHLMVWYAPYYGKLMNIEPYTTNDIDNALVEGETLDMAPINVNELMKKQHNIRDRKTWICKFCGQEEDNIQEFALHISEHYTGQLRKSCELCKQRFFTLQSLKKHMFLTHNETIRTPQILNLNKTSPDVQNKANDQENEHLLGPLLSEMPTDNGLLEQFTFPDSTLTQESLTLNTENILSEEEHLNFEKIDVAKEPEKYVCDICVKPFQKLNSLILHLNAHTGKYTCKQCLTIFARKENFTAHKCLNLTAGIHKCTLCESKFSLSKYLRRHMMIKHKQGFLCMKTCRRMFANEKTLAAHNCEPKGKALHACNVCQKEFGNLRNLRRHLKLHENQSNGTVAPAIVATVYICEVCSKQFQSKKSLKQHLTSHKEAEFACQLCEKKFTRRTSYVEHMDIHKNESEHVCTICDAKFTLKKYLTNHLLLHTDELKFKCDECPQRFRHKMNLTKHFNNSHAKACKKCSQTFTTVDDYKKHMKEEHSGRTYKCPACLITVKLRSSLKRHVKQKHQPGEVDFEKLEQYIVGDAKETKTASVAKKSKKVSKNKNSTNTTTTTNINNSTAESTASGSSSAVSETQVTDTSQQGIEETDKVPSEVNEEMLSQCLLQAGLQVSNGVMQDLEGTLQLDEIVNVLGGKPADVSENVLDYGSIEMEFENNFISKADSSGITHTFDGNAVCLSMPELNVNEHGQTVTLGDSSFILENAGINGPVEQVVLYILDQKPAS